MPDASLVERLRAGGIVDPRTAIAEARRAGLPLALACALLEKESAGGQNVFGHDPSIFRGAGRVTREKYLEYRTQRRASGNRAMQGVGPCQLTWWEYQDAADREGGCWRPEINMRVGFRHLAQLVSRYGEADGARRYNGSGDAAIAYSRDLLAKAAAWRQRLAGLPTASAAGGDARLLRRGAEGELVRRLTRRLSFVRDRSAGRPYLDGSRDRFDAETEAALKAFQRDHDLDDDGVLGPRSARKLARAVEREKARRARGPQQAPAPAGRDDGGKSGADRPGRDDDRRPEPGRAGDAVEAAIAAAAASREADERLIARARRLRRAAREQADAAQPTREEQILLRIEGKLGELVSIESAEAGAAMPGAPAAKSEGAPAAKPEGAAQPAATAQGPVASTKAAEPAATAQGAPAPAMHVGEIQQTVLPPAVEEGGGGGRPPDRTSQRALVERIEALTAELDEARGDLIERVKAAEARLGSRGADRTDAPARSPKRRDPEDRRNGGDRKDRGEREDGRGRSDRQDRDEPERARPAKGHARPEERDPKGGAVVDIKLGAQSRMVQASKLAIAGYLAAKGNAEHAKLRRALRAEARTPKVASIATPRWKQGVRAVQHLERRRADGVLDGDLQTALQPFWPRDSTLRRVVRSTPAWRTIPGQLTPNFNVREFECTDKTPYLEGLVREQGLTRKQAKARARGLAERLERVRKAGGDRPLTVNSAFRTKAYNASLQGAVPNSAHTRGYAVDVSPPAGVSLQVLHRHMRAAFERGCGYYPPGRGNFVHGDFDPALPRRDW